MAHQAQLKYFFYIAANQEKVWEGLCVVGVEPHHLLGR
jgi:hypothetical protein